MKLNKLLSTVLATTLAFSVVSCGSSTTETSTADGTKEEAPATETAEATEGTLNVSDEVLSVGVMSSVSVLPIIVAQEQGYFEELGLKVDVQTFKAAKDRDAALQANALQGVIADEVAIAIYNEGGINMQVTGVTDGAFTLVTAPGSDITTFEQLKGKKVGISENTAIDYTLDLMLTENGLASGDVERVAVPAMPERLEMVKTGNLDAAVMPSPFCDDAIAAGAYKLATKDETNTFISTTAFLQETIDARPDDIKAFYTALDKAVEYIKTADKGELEDILIASCGYPETMKGNIIIPDFRNPSLLPSEEEVNAVFDWCRERGIVTSDLSAADVLNPIASSK